MTNTQTPKWSKWRHVPSVKRWQAIALSLDIEPDAVAHTDWSDTEQLAEIRADFADRLFVLGEMEGLQAATLSLSDPAESHVRLRNFAERVLSIGWKIPDELGALASPRANYASWTQRDTWTLMQTAHLLAGVEPDPHAMAYSLIDAVAQWFDRLKDAAISLPHLETMPSRSPELKGSHWVEHHKDVRVEPWRVTDWAVSRGLQIPADLEQITPRPDVPSSAQLLARIAELESQGKNDEPQGEEITAGERKTLDTLGAGIPVPASGFPNFLRQFPHTH